MGKSVLITGATGFVGRALLPMLADSGWQVVAGVRNQDRVPDNYATVFLDLEKPDTIDSLSANSQYDAIVHLGAHVDFKAKLSDLYVPNIAATASLLALAKRSNSFFVFASSALVAGTRAQCIESSTPENADIPYLASKQLGEQLVDASGVPSAILRIGGIFGGGGPDHLMLNKSINQAMRGNKPIIVGAGRANRNYIYVKDVAKAIAYALSERLTGTHLVAGTEICSIAEMLATLARIFRLGAPDQVEGIEAADQVISPSTALPPSRTYEEAFNDIRASVSL